MISLFICHYSAFPSSCIFCSFPSAASLFFLSLTPSLTPAFSLLSPFPSCLPRPHLLSSLSRYYAICCQPLVYRNKMTPLRIALMLGGCWVIPMFISFLPIMQGWNNIGIIDLVSIQADTTCLLCDPHRLVLSKQTVLTWEGMFRSSSAVV